MTESVEAKTVVGDVTALSFEDALAELEEIVKTLEQGSGSLDQSIDAYARGAALKKHCEAKLKEAQLKVDKIVFKEDGGSQTEPVQGGN